VPSKLEGMKTRFVCARVDAGLKIRAGKILAQEDLTLSEAIRTFLAEVVRQKRMPLQLAAAPRVVSGRKLWKMKRAQQARDRARAARGKLTKGHLLISPKQARETRVRWPDADLEK